MTTISALRNLMCMQQKSQRTQPLTSTVQERTWVVVYCNEKKIDGSRRNFIMTEINRVIRSSSWHTYQAYFAVLMGQNHHLLC
mmetsp:Transcript_10291/g.24705  ORF Transcript_10291/g.24705 Transcript_10291/m.24705 type:complete len:83 (-) Transcript_10291:378-626(-)